MTALDLITRRQYLEEELALAAATHQYVLDGPSPTSPADRDARDALLDRLRTRWTNALDSLTRHTDPARDGDPEWQGPVKERARHAAGALRRTRPTRVQREPQPRAAPRPRCGPPSIGRSGRCMTTKAATRSPRTHDAALDLAEAAAALLNELETRHTK